MSFPQIAPIPPAGIRLSIAPVEWEACLDAWLAVTQFGLRAPMRLLEAVNSGEASLVDFLRSYYHELAHLDLSDHSLSGPKARQLRKECFPLTSRILLETTAILALLQTSFLSDLCRAHAKSTALIGLLKNVWKQKSELMRKPLQAKKDSIVKRLDASSPEEVDEALAPLAHAMRASPDITAFYMTGSDFLDALVTSWDKLAVPERRKALVTAVYFGLLSLVKVEPPAVSVVTDHLYSLKTAADASKDRPSLIALLVTNTPLLSKLRQAVSGKSADRLLKLLDTLETYRSPSHAARPRVFRSRRIDKGKGRAMQIDSELHMHRLSIVTQVQDLFPDLSSGFIMKLLDEYGDDVEQVTAHLLENSLPPHLASLDRTEQAPIFDADAQSAVDHLAPRFTPPPSEPQSYIPDRRNVFDDDELDRLEYDTGRLHIGKKADTTAAATGNKAAILSALAAFDSDDDERDDTYDVEDVGGTVDNTAPDGEPGPAAKVTQEENEAALFTAYKSSPELFGRTFNIRRGQPRAALKAQVGWSDEQIEGWALMLQRDPRRLQKLEAQFGAAAFSGQQTQLERTSYRESPAGTETEDSDAPVGTGGPSRGGRGRGGRGRGGRGRGNVAGPSSDPNTANAQRRKEASKGSRANHNRRDQRAKKMARGGFAGPSG